MKHLTLSILLLFVSIQFLDAQLSKPSNINTLNAKQLEKLGMAAMEIGDWYSAVAYWEKYCDKKPNNAEGATQLGHAYKAARDFKAAEESYKRAFDLEEKPTKNEKAQFHWGMMQKINGDCDAAAENFKKFKKSYSSKEYEDAKDYYKSIRVALAGCELDSIQNNITIEHLDKSINGGYIEFSPMILDENTLIYGSLKDFKSEYYGKNDAKPVRKFYKAEKINDEWKGIGEWEAPFNFGSASTGSGAYSPDGKRFYFSMCKYNKVHKMICHIYVSKLEGKIWSEPEKLPEPVNLPDYSSSQPSVSIESFKNKEVVYFVSDRPTGKGGRDIWYATWKGMDKGQDKGWYTPRNCGVRINSAEDEYSPFYDLGSGQLYFSTSGDPGLGGLDIFSAIGEKGKWETPVNLGAPINSSYDDLFYVLNDDGETGFLTSNREGSYAFSHPHCCDDLYAFKPGPPPPPPVEEDTTQVVQTEVPKSLILEGRIVEELENGNLTDVPVSGALIKVNRRNSDGSIEFIRQYYTKDDGLFNLKVEGGEQYELSVKRTKYFNKNATVVIPETTGTFKKEVGLVPITDRAIVIKNIYYEFDKSNLTPEAKITLDTTLVNLLSQNPALIVEISSHTDGKGSDSYNSRLSQNRAESVVKYLSENGIDGRRLQAKGYGESQPIAPNKNEDGSDNPEGRQLNRRTEFKVVGELDAEIEYEP